jgi:formylglycine-generating enzyme required for sulfatase activity
MRTTKTLSILAALALTVAFAGCSSDEPIAVGGTTPTTGTPGSGRPIVFQAGRSLDAAKKTIYGATDKTATPWVTPTYWTAGDDVLIAAASNDGAYTAMATYDATEGWNAADLAAALLAEGTLAATPHSTGSAAITAKHDLSNLALHTGETELTWEQSTLNFYAFYPAGGVNVVTDAEGALTGEYSYTIPVEQYGDMRYAYMSTSMTASEPAEGVSIPPLNFTPFTTMIELTITGDVALFTIELTAPFPIAATYSENAFNSEAPKGYSNESNTIFINQAALSTVLTDSKTGKVYLSLSNRYSWNTSGGDPTLTFTFTRADGYTSEQLYTGEITSGNLYRLAVNTDSYTFTFPEPKMKTIPAGTFRLGGATDCFEAREGAYDVTLSSFQLGETEITQGQWEAVITAALKALQAGSGAKYDAVSAALQDKTASVENGVDYTLNTGANPSITYVVSSGTSYTGSSSDYPRTSTVSLYDLWPGTNPSSTYGVGPNFPAYFISHDDITSLFLPILNALMGKTYRLPTEAEWEYAARGGDLINDYAGATGGNHIIENPPFGFTSTPNETALKTVAWYWNNIPSQTLGTAGYGAQPVATKVKNGYDLYDMSGNVFEWCSDWYGGLAYTGSPATTGDRRIFRGGFWGVGESYSRVSVRGSGVPRGASYDVGFRVALSLPS